MKSNKKKYICLKCNKKFIYENELQKHKWAYHPSNKYEKFWSKCYLSNEWPKIGGTYFRDDPYY